MVNDTSIAPLSLFLDSGVIRGCSWERSLPVAPDLGRFDLKTFILESVKRTRRQSFLPAKSGLWTLSDYEISISLTLKA